MKGIDGLGMSCTTVAPLFSLLRDYTIQSFTRWLIYVGRSKIREYTLPWYQNNPQNSYPHIYSTQSTPLRSPPSPSPITLSQYGDYLIFPTLLHFFSINIDTLRLCRSKSPFWISMPTKMGNNSESTDKFNLLEQISWSTDWMTGLLYCTGFQF